MRLKLVERMVIQFPKVRPFLCLPKFFVCRPFLRRAGAAAFFRPSATFLDCCASLSALDGDGTGPGLSPKARVKFWTPT